MTKTWFDAKNSYQKNFQQCQELYRQLKNLIETEEKIKQAEEAKAKEEEIKAKKEGKKIPLKRAAPDKSIPTLLQQLGLNSEKISFYLAATGIYTLLRIPLNFLDEFEEDFNLLSYYLNSLNDLRESNFFLFLTIPYQELVAGPENSATATFLETMKRCGRYTLAQAILFQRWPQLWGGGNLQTLQGLAAKKRLG